MPWSRARCLHGSRSLNTRIFRNDRTLAQGDIDTIVKWVESGAPEGDPKDAPAPVQWPEKGWQIKPDIIVDLPEFKVPANGIVEWTDITIPGPFKEDTWITSMEILPEIGRAHV